MATYLIRKLEQFTALSRDDKEALERAASVRQRRLGSREDIFREGDAPGRVNLILDGWACRYKMLEDGRRQIAAFLLPGDLCDLRMFILRQMDHSVGTLSPVTVAEIPKDAVIDLTDNYPRISRALWWTSLVEEAIQREWTTNLGQRDALERMAHLLCEVFLRLRAVGLTAGLSCELPVTQAELADATGLSTVHVNRTIQELRARGLVILRGKTLSIPDLDALQDVALFSANYLHLGRVGREYDANDV
ncbi:MAG: Crp/Fnr family transcriptional regulator [Methylobacterium sp.]|uniref:Crp/Fnr family transcriptional regulator n=1 Tax=Methylobacterium sp. TaxID=409 RepID=UPI0025839F1F|nr:Crp/Fnr family transcriptional regulator [Methylobacterium sp.]MBY0294896.1 Crp/Fnr family transcriptional regulator [Methylobacterium sp.]